MTADLKTSCKGGLEDNSCFFLQPPNDFLTRGAGVTKSGKTGLQRDIKTRAKCGQS